MAEKNTVEGFQFLVDQLKANNDAVYGDLKDKAERRGLTVYPVMFGRAKAMLGLVKAGKRGVGKASRRHGRRPHVEQSGRMSAPNRNAFANSSGAA